eukprot:SRR837773.3937.p1 GENE.SRR837773.3937~~SRR837773.3937.p1  ORF type:complete len:402 (-),score=90.54 SRR837773.3937:2-1174(-)
MTAAAAERDLASSLAAASRLASVKRSEAEKERQRSATMQRSLISTQDSLRKTSSALSSLQYSLEAWRREALLKAQAGNLKEVAKMLSSLPSVPPLSSMQAGAGVVDQRRADQMLAGGGGMDAFASSLLPGGGGAALDEVRRKAAAGSFPRTEGPRPGGPRAGYPGSPGSPGGRAFGETLVDDAMEVALEATGVTVVPNRPAARDDPKLKVLQTRAWNPFDGRPPSSTVGDVALADNEDDMPVAARATGAIRSAHAAAMARAAGSASAAPPPPPPVEQAPPVQQQYQYQHLPPQQHEHVSETPITPVGSYQGDARAEDERQQMVLQPSSRTGGALAAAAAMAFADQGPPLPPRRRAVRNPGIDDLPMEPAHSGHPGPHGDPIEAQGMQFRA